MKLPVQVNIVESFYGYDVDSKMSCGMFVKEDVIAAIQKRKMASKVEAYQNEIIIFLSSRKEKDILLDEIFSECRKG